MALEHRKQFLFDFQNFVCLTPLPVTFSAGRGRKGDKRGESLDKSKHWEARKFQSVLGKTFSFTFSIWIFFIGNSFLPPSSSLSAVFSRGQWGSSCMKNVIAGSENWRWVEFGAVQKWWEERWLCHVPMPLDIKGHSGAGGEGLFYFIIFI